LPSKRIALLGVLAAIACAVTASTATASPSLMKGIYDDANLLTGDPDQNYAILGDLGTKVVRMNLHWGGPLGVAGVDPTVRPTDPNDGQYDWSLYDRAVTYATQYGIQVVFSIVNTPTWANNGRGLRVAPTNMNNLRDFAYAAAKRYSGSFQRPQDGRFLPKVSYWLAWNEPNNPIWLSPQATRGRFVSPQTYARICNAVVTGVRTTLTRGVKVGCGVTAPRGNNNPRSSRPSMTPIAFLRGMKRYGAKGFDAYAHHPYYGRPAETPMTPPLPRGTTSVTMGNIDVLDKELRRLYGNRMRMWITEYGYQTTPDRAFGVSLAKQASYMRQAWTKAKRHPRIDMFTWFMLKDDTNIPVGWQSGLYTSRWAKKPAYATFKALR
jgi:hypothetical protein